ncbi:DUF3710 domain-containing protein [Luteimicrobium subarcticum]|uniref:Uncharacterized protein DUF3710 n=1 Tax=Luteimicrobium subarcticum TaxID=620910 RepID=A0A2M8W447_9MICO|nr:DUF3710 domain-containing protein [Luteimicrobium subarcticum]PJI85704.1 uncharacterized protein DUF3710 [Luteimicrobium subarcticum]
MALFRRKPATGDDADPQIDEPTVTEVGADGADGPSQGVTEDAAAGSGRESGPYDSSETEQGGRLDLGALQIAGVPGMSLRLEIDRRTGRCTGAACAVDGSVLQLQAFAAPRSEGIWDEIREEIAASVGEQGGAVDEVPGPFGRELLARLPVVGEDGRRGFRPARFVGVDGPRWFLRGVITGRAAVEPQAAELLELVFRNTVVVRGTDARPPRDVLELTPPQQPDEGDEQAPAAPQPGDFDPLRRGPEITEIR